MIDTDEIRRNLEAGNGEGAAISVAHVLCDEVDRLRAKIANAKSERCADKRCECCDLILVELDD
jgi:hypothetical protein